MLPESPHTGRAHFRCNWCDGKGKRASVPPAASGVGLVLKCEGDAPAVPAARDAGVSLRSATARKG